MRQINKSSGVITRFNQWARSKKFHNWSEFSSPQSQYHAAYEQVRDHISIVEQCCLSAYTEKPLGDSIHIDHYRKRSIYPLLTFDYGNFLVDDLNDNYGACFKDNHAGVSSSTFDGRDRIFCPVGENMADLIDFTLEGTMIPKKGLEETEYRRVNETIRVFNLNHRTLKDLRKNIISNISDYKSGDLPDDDIRTAMEGSGFPTLVNWALNTIPKNLV